MNCTNNKINKNDWAKWMVFVFMFIFSACQDLAMEEGASDRAMCEEGFEFKTLERRCVNMVIENAPPVATLREVTISEDSDPVVVELLFSDQNEDVPLGCDILSYSDEVDGDGRVPVTCFCDETVNKCYARIKPDRNYYSHAEFSYVIFDQDGRSNEQFVYVNVTPIDDPPTINLDNFSPEAGDAVRVARGIGANNLMSEDTTKVFSFYASDPDGDLINQCEIVDTSENIEILGECLCEPSLNAYYSTCNVTVKAKQNFNGSGEYFNYRVLSKNEAYPTLYSELGTYFINISPVDDAPVLCHASSKLKAPECADTGRDACIGDETPTFTPSSHTSKIPVVYLNETTAECFRSIEEEDGSFSWVGSIRDEDIFLSGSTKKGSSQKINYIYGADFVELQEEGGERDSVSSFLTTGFDIDNPRSTMEYEIVEVPNFISVKGCFGIDDDGDVDPAFANDVDCTFEVTEADYNDHILADTITLQNNEEKIPTLRFRARQKGDLKKTAEGPVCLSLIGGNSNGGATVALERRGVFQIENGPYCYGGYGDEVEYNNPDGEVCAELGVATYYLNTSVKIISGDQLSVSAVNPTSGLTEQITLTFSDCGDTCTSSQISLDSGSGAYKNNYADYTSILARKIRDKLRGINEGASIAAKIDEENPNHILLRSRALAPKDFLVSETSSGVSVLKIQPYWVYRGDAGGNEFSCVGDNGELGNHIIVSIEDGVTTSAAIKSAIESHETVSELVEVFMYGSVAESYKPYNDSDPYDIDDPDWTPLQWPIVLRGGREFADSLSYIGISDGKVSNVGQVFFNISEVNDSPTLDTGTFEFTGVEEQTLKFSLPVAEDVDFLENLFYEIDDATLLTLEENGDLRGCLNLEGSDGPWDLTCEFIPNENYNNEGSDPITFKYRVIDSEGEVQDSTEVTLNIEDENDPAFMCQFDGFKEAPECGLQGCIGRPTPVGRITPTSHTSERPIVFYSQVEQACFKSTGNATSDDWEVVVGSIIRDIEINQFQKITIENLIVDEGGGADEDSQHLGIFSFTYPDEAVETDGPDFLPVDNIKIYDVNGDKITNFTDDDPAPFLDAEFSGDASPIRLEITPVAGQSGTTTLRIIFGDFIGNVKSEPLLQKTFAEFKVTLNQVSLKHNGWKNLKVLGARIGGSPYCEIKLPITNEADYNEQKKALTKVICEDVGGIWRRGDLVDAPNVCSFSETLCNGGEKCIGTDHQGATADEFNAIFKNTTSNTCYAAKSTLDVGQAKLVAKKSGGIFIYVEHIDSTLSSFVEEAEEKFPGEYNHTSFIHLKLNPNTTYDQLGQLISGSTFDDDMDCDDFDASCLLSVHLPSLSETTSELSVTTDFPEGLYYLGVKKAYVYQNRGLLVATYKSGLSVTVEDNDAAVPVVTYNDEEKNLLIQANSFIEDIKDVRDKINENYPIDLGTLTHPIDPDILIDSFENPLFAAFIYKNPTYTISAQAKTNFSTSNPSYYWQEIVTPCSISQSDELSSCRTSGYGGSCLVFDAIETSIDENAGADYNSSFYDQKNNKCYRLSETNLEQTDQTFEEYTATGSVTLEWEDFDSGDSSIAGFNVYRKIGTVSLSNVVTSATTGLDENEYLYGEFDFTKPINQELLASNVSKFTDDFDSSRHPPLPGTVYYYTVRPVVIGSNGEQIVTNSMEDYSVIRVFSPLENFAFVHRWIANQTMCELMHSENRTNANFSANAYKIDKNNNFRCRYYGIGMSDENGEPIVSLPGGDFEAYYDIGYDMVVNQSELSCSYSRRQCDFDDNEYPDLDCIGNATPDGSVTSQSDHAVFYDRSTAKCYVSTGEGTKDWEEISVAASIENLRFGVGNVHLPPMSNISKTNADNLCDLTDEGSSFGLVDDDKARLYNVIIDAPGPEVPSRLQQRAFGLWSDDLSHEEIEIIENGLSLNSTSRCNTNNANGLDEEFTSSTNPPVNTPSTVTATDLASFTWRDNESKLIRSLMTGSDITKNCQSRFGIQDHVGNLSEWSDDFFQASGSNYTFNQIGPGVKHDFYNLLKFSEISGGTDYFTIGISTTDESDVIEDRNYVIDSATDIIGALNIPMGFPIRPNAISDIDSAGDNEFTDFIFTIGNSNGIETDHLHNDRHYFFQDEDDDTLIDFPGLDENYVLYGGGFRDGGGAGVYFLQLENPLDATRADLGTRCVHRIKEEYYSPQVIE